MQLKIISSRTGSARHVDLTRRQDLLAFGGPAVLAVCGIFALGILVGRVFLAGSTQTQVAQAVERQKLDVQAVRSQFDGKVDAMAARVGSINAQMIRLDALGRRLTDLAGLDRGEFDFDHVPPAGGPDTTLPAPAGGSAQMPELDSQLSQLEAQLEDRENQLMVLENLLSSRHLGQRIQPGGLPIIGGWISSHFGYRSDPFTGQGAFHSGVDFAGKPGTPIIAVGPGTVSFSGYKNGYGNVVEITHPSGYLTRYGHNSRNLVRVGESVQKDQEIAVIGSTGRSTGTHVHFEVEKNGSVVNPMRYLQTR
jgi:murein DD-endopeptidase MepM/ murein hydrolase activator NlpD